MTSTSGGHRLPEGYGTPPITIIGHRMRATRRADSAVPAGFGRAKDGNLRVVYAGIGPCQERPVWRGTQAAVVRPYPAVTCHVGGGTGASILLEPPAGGAPLHVTHSAGRARSRDWSAGRLCTLAYRPCASGDETAQITDVRTVRLPPCQALRISFRRSHRLHRQIQPGCGPLVRDFAKAENRPMSKSGS